jgi:hypothetical protein
VAANGSIFKAEKLTVKEEEIESWNLCVIGLPSHPLRNGYDSPIETVDCTFITLDFPDVEKQERFELQLKLVQLHRSKQSLNYEAAMRLGRRHQTQGPESTPTVSPGRTFTGSTMRTRSRMSNSTLPTVLDVEISSVGDFGLLPELESNDMKPDWKELDGQEVKRQRAEFDSKEVMLMK